MKFDSENQNEQNRNIIKLKSVLFQKLYTKDGNK